MTFTIVSLYATRYYVNVLKIDTAIMATILLIWNIWDTVNDPLMGALMDKVFAKKQNPKGKFHPWLLRATPLLTVTAIIFFTVPTLFEGTALLVVLFFSKILYEGCYTVSSLVPVIVAPLILGYFGDSNPIAYAVCIVVFAIVGFVMCLLHYSWTEERTIVETTQDEANNIKITDILQVFEKNRAFLALCLHSVFVVTQNMVYSTLGTYMYSDVLGSITLMSLSTLMVMSLSFLFLGFAPKLAKKLGLTNLIRHALLISITLYVGLFAAHMLTDVNPYVHMIWAAACSAFAGISTQQQWGLVGEAIDYNEHLTGKRTEGSIYGTFSLSRRVGTTIGNSLGVLMLGWIGYDPNLAVQSAGTLTGIKILCVLLPAIFLVGSWASFKFVWNINDETRGKMHAYFEGKKAEAAQK